MNYSTTKQNLASVLGQVGTGGHTNHGKKELCNKKKIVGNDVKSHYVSMRPARLKGRLYGRGGIEVLVVTCCIGTGTARHSNEASTCRIGVTTIARRGPLVRRIGLGGLDLLADLWR